MLLADDAAVNFVAAGYDAAIRIGEVSEQGMIAVRLSRGIALAIEGAAGPHIARAFIEVLRGNLGAEPQTSKAARQPTRLHRRWPTRYDKRR
jgi:hypothetical protein